MDIEKLRERLLKAGRDLFEALKSAAFFSLNFLKKIWLRLLDIPSVFQANCPTFYRFSRMIKNYLSRLFRWLSVNLTWLKRRFFLTRFQSVKFEISVIYTLILGIVLVSFSGIFYVVISRTLYQELDNELKIKAQGIFENIHSYLEIKGEEPKTLRYAVEQTIAREDEHLRRWWYIGFERSWFKKLDEQDLSQDFVNFISIDKSFNVKSKNLQDELLDRFSSNIQLNERKENFWDLDFNNKAVRVINYPYPNNKDPTHIIQIGISKGPVILLLKKWMTSVLISIPIVLFLTGFIGRLLASHILRPVDRIIDTANEISYENLNLRVKPKHHYREMDRLVKTFNDMISRLEKSFEHIDEFSAHVAHELKTPLTIVRGEAELSLMEAKSHESKESMQVIIDEIDRVLKTIEDLLYLSKTSYEPESFEFKEINFNEFLSEIVEQIGFIADKKNINIQLKGPLWALTVRADKLHLRRLFYNLLDNAIKFTPVNGKINIKMYTSKKKVHVYIRDTGFGIAEENLSKIFDQFYREENRQKGVGLGLSIAQAIAKAHSGMITVKSQIPHGTTFTVTLPFIRLSAPVLIS